ncbi:MAG: hypothetical protein KBD15_02315 [Candidatus Magasanikbacteria bacterium]|nr:hypothetical protein [Candidatus Magasanikbacteria bacterium]
MSEKRRGGSEDPSQIKKEIEAGIHEYTEGAAGFEEAPTPPDQKEIESIAIIDLQKKFPKIKDGDLTHRVTEMTTKKLILEIDFGVGGGKREKGIYRKMYIEEMDVDVYLLDTQQSDSGVLPHGSACYLPEWDIILVRGGEYGLLPGLTKKALSSHQYTVLAHELGHREDHRTTDKQILQESSYGEKEIRAWENAKKMFGNNPKFDHIYANRDLDSYKVTDATDTL